MAFVTLNCTLKDVLTDATGVALGSADSSYGIINPATGAIIVPDNTPVLHYLTGIYLFDVSALPEGIQYQVSWQITYDGTVQYATAPFTLGTPIQLADVKTYLRIDPSDTSFDGEVQDLMNAVQTDLIALGVNPDVFNSGDSLLRRVITTYCKANFGYDTDNAPQFSASYEKMKIFLMNCAEYRPVVVALENSMLPSGGSR